jgi:D-alanyl-D-alanine carboxypeptidase
MPMSDLLREPALSQRFSGLHGLALAAGITLAGTTAPALAGPVLVVDASTGQVLKAEEATRPWHPASTTKMMTAYLALKAVKSGRLGLETAIPASALAAKQPRVKVYIKAGQEITLDNAMKIMMVKSANDISYVIAEGVGGTVENFVAMMNAEARRLGMGETVFANPNGWHHPQQQTSARDLAILAMALMRDFPEYADYWGIGAVQLGKQRLNNTNGLVGRYPGINGFKTGFVCASGFNVVASATRGGRTLIAVVLGALSGAERTVVAAQALDEAFSSGGGWSSFGGSTLASLPYSGYSSATNICAQVRARGGGAALADDADIAGPLSFGGGQSVAMSDNGMSDRFGSAPQPAQGAGRSAGGGRYVLSARAEAPAIVVGFGRTAGSARAPLAANVARRADTQLAGADAGPATPGRPKTLSANGAIPVAASAFTATGGAAPLKLQGSSAATPVALRPGAAAGIRARSAAKPAEKAVAPKTQSAKAVDGKAKAAEAKAKPAAKVQQKTAAAKPASTRPASAKPATVKPAGAKPVLAKPAAPKPADD